MLGVLTKMLIQPNYRHAYLAYILNFYFLYLYLNIIEFITPCDGFI